MALPAVIGAIGSVLGSVLGFKGQSDANAANLREAQRNRDFQERMSGTAYSRAVQDLRAAGLNPALAYQQGGASAPSGSTAASQENALAVPAQNMGVLAQTLASAALTSAQASKAREEAGIAGIEKGARKDLLHSETARNSASAAAAHNQALLTEQQLDELQATFPERSQAPGLANVKSRLDNILSAGTVEEKIEAAKLVNALTSANIKWTGSRAEIMSRLEKVLSPWLTSAGDGASKFKEIGEIVEALWKLYNPFSKPGGFGGPRRIPSADNIR